MPFRNTYRPKFDLLKGKSKARIEMVRFYSQITGRTNIPSDKQYWCLCGEQSLQKGSEIIQLTNLGFLKKEQFYGVDREESIITENRKNHPEAHWFNGEWQNIILKSAPIFRPAVIYLDTMNLAGKRPILNITRKTMDLTPPHTILFINVMLNNPRPTNEVYTENDFLKQLGLKFSYNDFKRWKNMKECFIYRCSQTTMATYAFVRTDYEL